MALSRSERISRRDIVCRPPRYPGTPKDYEYVEEHCRKAAKRRSLTSNDYRVWRKKAESDFKKANMKKPIKASSGEPAVDKLIHYYGLIQKATPDYINHMFQGLVDKKMIKSYPDLESRWNAVNKAWKRFALPDQARLKYNIAKMLEKAL